MEPIGANMTVASEKSRIDYDPDGATLTFPYDFKITQASDLAVYADGVVVASGYGVNGVGEAAGGDVVFIVPPEDAIDVLSFRREVPLTQETQYPVGGPFPAPSHEAAMDKITYGLQQMQEQLNRAGVGILPVPVEGKRLQWNSGGLLINVDSEDAEAAGYAAAAEASSVTAQEQVPLCQDEVTNCEEQLTFCEDEVILCEDQVVIATAQADAAAVSAANAALYDPTWEAWQDVTLAPDWSDFGGLWEALQIRKSADGHNLQFKGAATLGGGGLGLVGILPLGYTPTSIQPLVIQSASGAAYCDIRDDGTINVTSASSQGYFFGGIIALD